MSQALQKCGFKRERWIEKSLKFISVLKLSRFCCLFSLRQGTILIGIIELSLTFFCLFLLLLSATHMKDVVALVKSDLERLEDCDSCEGKLKESTNYIINNERKLLTGQHLAIIMMFTVWAGLLLTIIHFISCALLLYGAIRRLPNFTLPWISTGLFSLISGFFSLVSLVFIPLQGCLFGFFAILLSLYGIELYSWLTVFSYYQELKTLQLKGFGGVFHNITDAEKELTNAPTVQTIKLGFPL